MSQYKGSPSQSPHLKAQTSPLLTPQSLQKKKNISRAGATATI
jgi:hypothetical protein